MKASIRFKCFLFVFSAIFLTGASVWLYSWHDRWRVILARIEGDIHDTAKFVAANVADDLYFRNTGGLRRELEHLTINRQILSMRLLAWDGTKLVEAASTGDDKLKITPAILNQAFTHNRWMSQRVDDRLEGVIPIVLPNGQRLGAFYIVASLKTPLEALKLDAIGSIVVTLIAIFAAAILVWSFAGRLLADNTVSAETARAIGVGNLATRVMLERDDQLGALGESINHMAEALRENQEARTVAEERIIQLKFDLEETVAQRTAELAARNEDLATEIARRVQLEESLRAIDARHRAVVEIAPDAVVTVDDAGHIVEFNKVAETTFGYHRQDVLGRPMADYLIPPEQRAGYQAGFALMARGDNALLGKRVEITAMRAGGERFPVEFAMVPIDISGGRLLTAFMRDITERKRRQNAIQGAEQKLRELVETAQAIIWETDARTWKFSFVSQGAEAILGYPVRRWLAEPHFWPMIIHKDDRATVLSTSREQTKAGLDHELEYRALTGDGRVVWIKDIVRVIKDDAGRVVGLRGIKIDITSRKQVEDSLHDSLSGMLFVQKISRKLLIADNLAIALEEILRECVVRGNFDLGTILLNEHAGAKVKVMASYGYREPQNIWRDKQVGGGAPARYRSMSLKEPSLHDNIQGGERLRTLRKEGAESALLVPIGQGENSIGFFQLATRSKTAIDRRLIPLMETVGQQIGMSIQKARLFDETQRNFKRAAALHEINLAATSTLDLDSVLDLLLTQVEAFLPYSAGSAIRLIDPASGKLELKVARNFPAEEIEKFLQKHTHTFAHAAFASKAPLWVADAPNDPRCPDPEFYRRHGMASYLGVPLLIKGEAIGVLSLLGHEQREVRADEIEFVNLLAGQAAMAIHNANLYGDLQHQAAQIEAARELEERSRLDAELLAEISHEILAAGENDSWLETILRKAAIACGFDLGTVSLRENGGRDWQIAVSHGYRDSANIMSPTGQNSGGYSSWRAESSDPQSIVWERIQEGDGLATLKAEGARIALTVPVKSKSQVVGLLQLASRSRQQIDTREVNLVEAIAEQISAGIQKSRLLNATKADLQRRKILHEVNLAVTSTLQLDEVLARLVKALSRHIPYAFTKVIRLFDAKTGRMRVAEGANLGGQAMALFDTLAMANVKLRDVLVVTDLASRATPDVKEYLAKRGLCSYLGVPLVVNEVCLGVLSIATRQKIDFSDEEIDLFRLIGGQAAMAIHNAKVYQDLRAQKAAIEKAKEIEAAAAAKSRFLAMMSHEIRTPLNAVLSLTDVLLRSELTDDQRKMTETISQSGSGLLQIINDVLDFSKIEADKVAIELVDFDLLELVHGAGNVVAQQARAKGVTLTFRVAPEVPQVITGDSGRIRQILLNLLSNAVKFTAQGTVTVSVEVREENSDGMQIKFAVNDEGIGIAPEALDRLFQPFTQADSSTTRKFGGTGLGLAISKRLAELLGGSMNVESEAGKGSTFWFTVFARRVEQQSSVKTKVLGDDLPVAVESPISSDARILLVEDNPVNQMVALRLLELLGLHADVAADGAEAVEVVEWQNYDLLLMDCEMPNMDGYQATAEIRRREADTGRRTRIVAMTANAMAGDREKCLEAGMDDYIAKPVQLDTLQAALVRSGWRHAVSHAELSLGEK